MAEKSTNKNTDKLYKALLSPKKALRAIINDMGGGIDDSTPYADYVTKYNGHKISAYVINAVNNLGTTLTTTIATKVDKTSSANKVYGTNGSGVQVTIDVDNYPNAEGSIARRSAQTGHVGQIQVPLTPIANGEASSKQYVDKSTAKSLVVSMDNSTYVITFTLKDGNNNTLSTQSVDLPLESTVVNGNYDDDTQSLVLTLKSGSTITIPIDDLIDGLVSSTDLSTTLANYYTKTEADNEFVDKTSTETITGEKTFEGDLKFKGSGTTTVGQITTASNSVKIGYGGVNHVSIDGGNFHTNVADYDLGSSSKKWRDVYVSRNLTDGTNAITVANILAQDNAILYALNNLRSMFYETTVDVETMLENYLSFKALPLTLSSKNIIFSAGMDLKNIKGNSFVYNQYSRELNSTYWTFDSASGSFSDGVATFTASATSGKLKPSATYRPYFINGHKYLMVATIKTTTATTQVELNTGFTPTSCSATTNWQTLFGLVSWETTSGVWEYPNIVDRRTSDWDAIQVKDVQLIDLTQSKITASDATEAKAELLKRGVNVDEYNPYKLGQIRNSQPELFRSNPFNIWDEVTELGGINTSTGADTTSSSTLRSENYQRCNSSTDYYFRMPSALLSTGVYVYWYDSNKTFIKAQLNNKANGIQKTSPSNAVWFRIVITSAYGTTYNHDICINISNASLNGTYKPYVAPDEKTLTIPVLRSAGTVQDDCNEVKVGTYTFTGSESWALYDSSFFYTIIAENMLDGILLTSNGIVAVANNSVQIRVYLSENPSLTTSSDMNTIFSNGTSMNYTLITPTPQSPAITLPQDIKIYAGGSIEVVYDSTNSCPSDFEFEVATSKIVEE